MGDHEEVESWGFYVRHHKYLVESNSFKTWLLKEEGGVVNKHIPDSSIYIDLPSVEQTETYSCGAACFRAVCHHFGVSPDLSEDDFISRLGTSPDAGTSPPKLVSGAKKFKLKCEAGERMTLPRLREYLRQGIPVVCDLQAWGTPGRYRHRLCGHYVVAIGFDEEYVYFMDPAMGGGARGYLSNDEFLDRWHDQSDPETPYIRWGMAIWKNGAVRKKQRLHKVKKIK